MTMTAKEAGTGMTHRIDWTRYGEQTIAPDRIVTAVCGETVTGGDAREYPTCPDCIQEVQPCRS